MRVAVFFVSLLILLFSGNSHIHANIQFKKNISYTQAQHDVNISRITYANTHQYYSIVKPINLDKEIESIICDDIEDENSDNFFVKKCNQQAHGYIIHCWLSYLSILNHLSNSYKAAPILCGKVSHIYILQRVLRI
jgi:hypothetical protein